MLNSSLKTVGVTNVNVVAILNDTTGTLVAGSHDFPNTAVGKIQKSYLESFGKLQQALESSC